MPDAEPSAASSKQGDGSLRVCNSAKGPNVAGYDPESDDLTPLFNPRLHQWEDHFEWSGAILTGKTAAGRATIQVLRINRPERIEHRRTLGLVIEEGHERDSPE